MLKFAYNYLIIRIQIASALRHKLNAFSRMCVNTSPYYNRGTLRIRQGWFKLELRVGGLGSVINGSYIITGKQQNLAYAA